MTDPDQTFPVSPPPHETAAATEPGISAAHESFRRTLEEFREANDARLAELQTRGSADVLLEEKVDRMNTALSRQQRALDELALAFQRPDLDAGHAMFAPEAQERKAAFDAYVRTGALPRGGPLALGVKALSGTDDQGGYLAPDEVEVAVARLLSEDSPIRALATVRRISAGTLRQPVSTTQATAGWVAETASRAQATTPTFAELEFPAAELYSMPAATQTLLDDAAIDIGAWLASEVRQVFADKETEAFISGDGSNKPKGILAHTVVADAQAAWNKIGFIASGAAASLAATNPVDRLLDLVFALKPVYRGNAHWLMSRKTQAVIRKLKDSSGNYLWQPGAGADAKSTLLNFPVVEVEDMPEIAANAYALAFGDFRRGYLVADRMGMRILRDPYSSKPYVLFYVTRRVGGGVADAHAIKLMKIAAS